MATAALGAGVGAGAPGMTHEGTPTFGSPDREMATRPSPMGAELGREGQPPEGGEDLYSKTEQDARIEELEESIEDLKRQFLKEEPFTEEKIREEIERLKRATPHK